jgi:predicted nucleotidyltransferase
MAEPSVVSREFVLRALRDALADEAAVVAAYLFGSVSRGAAGPSSDIDDGLLFDLSGLCVDRRVGVRSRYA